MAASLFSSGYVILAFYLYFNHKRIWTKIIQHIQESVSADAKMNNIFSVLTASALLLPKSSFGRDVQAYPTDLKYYLFLKKKWKASMQAMVYRSHQLGIITENQFQYMMRQISKNGWRTKEPGDVPYALNENIFQGAVDLLIEEKILSPANVMQTFRQYGIALYRQDIEELLHLREGTLFVEESKPQILQLKRSHGADGGSELN